MVGAKNVGDVVAPTFPVRTVSIALDYSDKTLRGFLNEQSRESQQLSVGPLHRLCETGESCQTDVLAQCSGSECSYVNTLISVLSTV